MENKVKTQNCNKIKEINNKFNQISRVYFFHFIHNFTQRKKNCEETNLNKRWM